MVVRLAEVPQGWDDPVLTREQAVKLLENGHVLLAVDGVGYLVLAALAGMPADVVTVFVKPEFRQKGHGEALLRKALEVAESKGCTGITLEVDAGNQPAVRLYEACGFVTVATRGGYYGVSVRNPKGDALVMAVSFG